MFELLKAEAQFAHAGGQPHHNACGQPDRLSGGEILLLASALASLLSSILLTVTIL